MKQIFNLYLDIQKIRANLLLKLFLDFLYIKEFEIFIVPQRWKYVLIDYCLVIRVYSKTCDMYSLDWYKYRERTSVYHLWCDEKAFDLKAMEYDLFNCILKQSISMYFPCSSIWNGRVRSNKFVLSCSWRYLHIYIVNDTLVFY